jgi:hypothetical protein
MNKTITERINWQTFKDNLTGHEELSLQFQYAEGQYADKSYHITEIKQAIINSVDCGGAQHSWAEIIMQLWIPENPQQEEAMGVKKALSIIDIVEKKMPLSTKGIVKIEYGNSDFDTRQMYPAEFNIDNENLIVNLVPDLTQCKASEGSCGNPDKSEQCCLPPQKEKLELATLSASVCCALSGNCC